MGFLFGNTKENKLVAIFDIGSGSVGASIVKMPKDKNSIPTIIKTIRTDIKYRNELDFNLFLEDMLVALNNSADLLYKSKVGSPEEIMCVLASPWYISETRIVKMSRETSFVFTKRLASELLEKEVSSFGESYNQKYGNIKSSLSVIEHHIMGVLLNGYLVESPIGVKSKSVEMNMIISLSPKLCIDKIKQTLSNTFHHTPVDFSSFMVASFLAIRDKYILPDSYLLLDIGGEVTDVGIVYRGILKASLSFPFGKKTFFKYICDKLEIELRDAKELFNLIKSNNLNSTKKEEILPVFNSVEALWSESFRKCIGNLPRTLSLPSTVFLTADNDIIDWFANIVKSEEYIQSMLVDHKCNVVTLQGTEFLNMCDVKNDSCDPFLMIESIAMVRKAEIK